MVVMPTSIKFTPEQRQWLQAEAKRSHNGKIGSLVKAMVDRKRKSIKRTKAATK